MKVKNIVKAKASILVSLSPGILASKNFGVKS